MRRLASAPGLSPWLISMLVCLAQASRAGENQPDEPAVEAVAAAWSGWLTALEEYRFRATRVLDTSAGRELLGDERDHDLRLFLDGGLTSPSGAFGAGLAAALWLDADGGQPRGEATSLAGQFDHRRPWWDVYSAWAEYRSDGVLRLVRGGRQVSEQGEPLTFDGLSVLVRAAGPLLDLFAYGGRTVHFFETQAGLFEDWLASAGLVVRPLEGLRLELDYRFQLEDILTSTLTDKSREIDHGYGLSLAYARGDWLRARVHLRGLDDQVARAGLAVHLFQPDWLFGLRVRLDAQPSALARIAEAHDPFHALLGPSQPHLRWRLEATKDFETGAGRYGLQAGFTGRHLLAGEAGPFNRESGHVYLAASAHDPGLRGLYASLSLEEHFTFPGTGTGQDHHLAVGGLLGYRLPWLEAEAGSFYQRVKVDYFATPREVLDVRTVYGSLGLRVFSWLQVRARYEYEWTDRDVHTLTLALVQSL
jgi:hypothetical protein